MGKNQLLATAKLLYSTNMEIKRLTELADGCKRDLRGNVPDEGLDIGIAICKNVTQIKAKLDNKKLYKQLTYEEILTTTKPVMAEIKKILGEDEINKCATAWESTDCIKFYPIEK